MKVEGPKAPASTSRAGPAKRAGESGSFSRLLESGETEESGQSGASAAPSSVPGLFMLQGESDAERKKRDRATNRARDALSLLDQITYALLNSGVSTAHLARLKGLASVEAETVTDPRLAAVLDEIDLRLAVETAKLEKAAESRT